ncbi:MAG: permease prefix domain 2-containing transporter [Acidobacteriia bacterium]|nr:permease prefix domain 2-containing transporter [Terriglobia bacterium]
MRTSPPRWAEALLRLFLKPEVFASVSGDLLEQYRDSVHPARGLLRADQWYVTQVLGFVLRGTRLWAVLFAAAYVARTAFDWLRPTTDFQTRSEVSTALAAGILLASGFWVAWRSGSFATGAAVGLATTAIAAVLSIAGVAVLLAIWHDPQTMAAIRGSGDLEESLVLPTFLILPGVAIAGVGGLLGATARRLVRIA